jgi:molybdate transport system ATP-binding protein
MGSEHMLEARLYVAGAQSERPRLDVSLRAGPGVTLIWGPSGAGKSTCLLALAGLVRPQRGHVLLDGRILFDAQRRICVPTRARKIGLVFQALALFPHLNVRENVAFGVSSSATPRQRDDQARRWLARMRVGHLESRRVSTLSGGEAQRVALARVLASAPRLLLLDEPFSALDRTLRDELSEELTRVVAELQVPTLMVSHHEDDLARWPAAVIRLGDARPTALSNSSPWIVANPTWPAAARWQGLSSGSEE